MGHVMVLHSPLAVPFDAERAAWLLERLPYGRRLELERRSADARASSLRALELLIEGVTRLRGATLELSRLRFPEGGKPVIEGGPWFSVSHSASRVAVALSDACEVGFDVEDAAAPGLQRERLDRWTAIEAVLKAAGAGMRRSRDVRLADDLATAGLDDRAFFLQHVTIAADCIAQLATPVPVKVGVAAAQG